MSGGRRYRFGPLAKTGVVGPLRVGQVAVLAVAALMALGSMYALRNWLRRRRGSRDLPAVRGADLGGMGTARTPLGSAVAGGAAGLPLGESGGWGPCR
jgi:hypothetical protein